MGEARNNPAPQDWKVPEKDCCCCNCCEGCNCSILWSKSRGRIFYCCCPLKLGIYLIDFTVLFLAIYVTVEAILLCFNQYIDGWYILVLFICFIPLYWAVVWFFKYTYSDKAEDRNKLKWGCVLALVSIVLYTTWTCIYISHYYSEKNMYLGMGDPEDYGNYRYTSKKSYLIQEVIISSIWAGLFIYFIFACHTWEKMADN